MAPTPKKEGETKKVKRVGPKPVKKAKVKVNKRSSLLPGTVRYGRKKRAIIKKFAKQDPLSDLKRKALGKRPLTKKTVKKTAKDQKPKDPKLSKEEKAKKDEKKEVQKVHKPPKYYPTEDKPTKRKPIKKVKPGKLKKSLTPGTICIVLAGPHKGKRVIFLKQLQSGLCLITGPFTLNRCPLRRINQSNVIGTSTKVSLPKEFSVPQHIDDKYFKRVKLNRRKPKKDEGDIFASKVKKYVPNKVRKDDQKTVDVPVLKAIKKMSKRKSICAYLSTKFSLDSRQYPHALKF